MLLLLKCYRNVITYLFVERISEQEAGRRAMAGCTRVEEKSNHRERKKET